MVELTTTLLQAGTRSPAVLLMRANSLLGGAVDVSDPADRERAADSERLATEILDRIGDNLDHPAVHKAYVVRATARQRLGDQAGADEDLRSASRVAPNDPDRIRITALWESEKGDERSALQILKQPVVDDVPLLVVMRAGLEARLGDVEAARRDIEHALQSADEQTADEVRFGAADAALALKEPAYAEHILSPVTPDGERDMRHSLLRGRIALARGDFTGAEACYRNAVLAAPSRLGQCLADLGASFHRAGRSADAVRILAEAGTQLPTEAYQLYAMALMQDHDLPGAQALIDRLAQKGPLPTWALRIGTNIALAREDVESAVAHLSALVERGQGSPEVRLTLCSILIEEGRTDDARLRLESLLVDADVSPKERMRLAHLLHVVGRKSEALQQALRSFRDGAQDPWIHRAFVVLMIDLGDKPDSVTETGADTHVRLTDDAGATREYTIFADGPADPVRNEITVCEAEKAGLIGRRVGDVVTERGGSWQEKRWTVAQILPAVVHLAQDVMTHYEDRFPTEDFFISGFQYGDGKSLRALAPIIASVSARKTQVDNVIAQYQAKTLPLGFVVKMAGGSLAEAMRFLITNGGPLKVEWSDRAGQEESVRAATEAHEVVLTRTAMETASDLGLLECLASSFRLVAPRSLRGELRLEVEEAEKIAAKGLKAVTADGSTLRAVDVEPGDPRLSRRVEQARSLLAWFDHSARIVPRPIEAMKRDGSDRDQSREIVGHSSVDAVDVAQHHDATLYADDLGLRRLCQTAPARSFSTVGLLAALARRAILSTQQRDRHLLTLLTRNYVTIPTTSELLTTALRAVDLPRSDLTKAFALLGAGALELDESARMVVRVIKSVVMEAIQVVESAAVVQLALTGMASRWPPRLCAMALQRAADSDLRLLPQHLEMVRRVCKAFISPARRV